MSANSAGLSFSALNWLNCPTPYTQYAWIGMLLWNPKQPEQQFIWFLKLPLDEQGLLV